MRFPFWIGLVFLAALSGCFSPFTRFQSAEENEREKDLDVPIVGSVTEFDNPGLLQVSGVGLVYGLEGTGQVPQGAFRVMLEKQLLKQRIEKVRELFDSPKNSLVLVSALVPPGHRKGEPVDVEVTLPPNSKTTSLRGGVLHDCPLRNFEAKNHISKSTSNEVLAGSILVRARGALLVGLGAPDEAAEMRRGRIWEGGVFLADRPLYLIMKKDEKSVRFANSVAERLNDQFREDTNRLRAQFRRLQLLDDVTQRLNQKFDTSAGMERGDVARVMTKDVVSLNLPYAYRLNVERYRQVARFVPLRESAEQRPRYRQRLLTMLLDPQDTLTAALRLEALGTDSIAALKKGLESKHPLVRFAAAESLVYLGNTAGVEQLALLATRYQQLRHPALLALANLDESVCRSKLAELLDHPDPELRSGAFVAFRKLDRCDSRSSDDRLGAELLNEAYWLHQLAPRASEQLVYVSLNKRAEIAIFGGNVALSTPVKILAGTEFAITAERFDTRCTVTRINANGKDRQAQCTLQLADVLRTMADLGSQYPEAVEFLRKADERKCLGCPLRIDNLPEPLPFDTLAALSRDPHFVQGD